MVLIQMGNRQIFEGTTAQELTGMLEAGNLIQTAGKEPGSY